MRAVTLKTAKLQCQFYRYCSSSFYDNLTLNEKYIKSRQSTIDRLDNKTNKEQESDNNDTTFKWHKAASLQKQESSGSIPGGQEYQKPKQYQRGGTKQQYQRPKQWIQDTENDIDSNRSQTYRRQTITKLFDGNQNIKLTFNDSSNGGKRDIYFSSKNENENNYLKKYTNFLIEHGFVEEQDINEQYEWLQESYQLQYDPDDPDGLRLPLNHKGRRKKMNHNDDDDENEWNEKELYFGKKFKKEQMEFNHFNKSFILDSCPAFPDKMIHHEPIVNNNNHNETPLYLPHISQNIPMWTLKKKIAKTYGPSYISQITMPPMKLPDIDDFQAMLKQFVNEKKYKKHSVEMINEINMEYKDNNNELYEYLNEREPNKCIDSKEFPSENRNRIKNLGVGTPFHDGEKDIISREYEIWDKDLCFELKHDGDPSISKEFKDEIFKQYVTSIDRNGSMASWQKNYAFSLLPKAFGGPEGDYIDAILAKLKPKQEKIQYQLKKYGHDGKEQEEEQDDDGLIDEDIKKKQKKKIVDSDVDVTGLGL